MECKGILESKKCNFITNKDTQAVSELPFLTPTGNFALINTSKQEDNEEVKPKLVKEFVKL